MTVVNGESVEIVDSFKYLGLVLDSKLSFSDHISLTVKKCQQRLYILRRLRSFHLDSKLLLNLYRSIIEPVLTYCSIIFLPSIAVTARNRLLKIANTASKIIGLPVPSVTEITNRAVLRKAVAVSTDPSHPLYDEFEVMPSGRRYRTAKCSKVKFRNSFIPNAVRVLNASQSGLLVSRMYHLYD